MRWATLALLISTSSALLPTSADACPRCNEEGFRVTLLEGRFEHFHNITRTLRVVIDGADGEYEERILVPGQVRPRRGDTVLTWNDLTRGMAIEVEVHESDVDRQVAAVRVVPAS